MTIEINLLEEKQRKYTAPIIFGIIFIVLAALVMTLLYLQRDYYAKQIETQQHEKAQLETAISEHQSEAADEQKLMDVQKAIMTLERQELPTAKLYHQIITLLADAEQLIAYDYTGESQLVVEAQFETLNETADYVDSLLAQSFIMDTKLTNISRLESVYQATLTIHINGERTVEELGSDA